MISVFEREKTVHVLGITATVIIPPIATHQFIILWPTLHKLDATSAV
jgi:hypothetical protein